MRFIGAVVKRAEPLVQRYCSVGVVTFEVLVVEIVGVALSREITALAERYPIKARMAQGRR